MRLTESWARRTGGPCDRHLLVVLHGHGSNERELLHRVEPGLPRVCDVVALRGPIRVPGGWAWAPSPADASVASAATPATAEAAAQPLLSWLEHQPEYPTVGLLGVSQGAVLALQIMRQVPHRIRCAVILAGYVLPTQETGDADLRRRRPPVWWGRGAHDAVVPRWATDHTAEWLPRHSTLTAAVYPSGHDLTDEMVEDATSFVASQC